MRPLSPRPCKAAAPKGPALFCFLNYYFTERVGESRSHFCGDGCFLAPHGCKRWSGARFSRASLARRCSVFRVLTGASRWLARWCERRSGNSADGDLPGGGRWEGADTTKRGATAPKSRFFSIPARLGAFSDSGRWQLRVAAGYGHRRACWCWQLTGPILCAWVGLLGSWGWFRPLSTVAGPAELAFLVKALFLNWAYQKAGSFSRPARVRLSRHLHIRHFARALPSGWAFSWRAPRAADCCLSLERKTAKCGDPAE